MLEEYPKLREQIEACTTSLCMITDINHAQYKELCELIMKVLTVENKDKIHSLMQLVRRKCMQIDTKMRNCMGCML